MARCGGNVNNVGWTLFFVCAIFSSTSLAEHVWSPWYNSSSPGHAGGAVEDETLDRITSLYTLPCPRSQVVSVQCRVSGSNVTFSRQFRHGGNVLQVPCNLTGLLCRLHDQILAGTSPCSDYEIRVLCHLQQQQDEGDGHSKDKDKGDDDAKSADSLGANGGFTAMVAGGSVVIPLTCVLIFQLRRYKREERQRQQQARQAAQDLARVEASSGSSDAPPTYEELFGRQEPVSTISSGELGSTPETERGRERLLSSYTETLEGRVNPGATLDLSEPSVASATAPQPASSSVSSASSTSTPPAGHVSSQAVLSQSSVSSSGTESTSVVSLSDASDRRVSTSSSSSSSSATSADALMPPSHSESDATHPGPPPAYDWPAAAHVTIVVPQDGSSTQPCLHSTSQTATSGSSSSVEVVAVQPTSSRVVSAGGRRFLGMHLSIFDLMAAIYPDPASTPPPSYDDALKILEASEQGQAQVQVT